MHATLRFQAIMGFAGLVWPIALQLGSATPCALQTEARGPNHAAVQLMRCIRLINKQGSAAGLTLQLAPNGQVCCCCAVTNKE